MQIVFGLHLDGLKPEVPQTVAGAATLGPKGLLGVLETQLGLPTPTPHPSEAPFSYLQCLREASSPDRFFHRSFGIDPVNVSRTLLDWREQWYEAGWDGTFPDDVPARLADMAAVEAIAKGRVPLTHGERLQSVAEALQERRPQFERVELHTPLDDLPHVWQRVINALPWVPATGLEFAPAGRAGSDLAIVQTRLLSMVNRDEERIANSELLQGDRSFIAVQRTEGGWPPSSLMVNWQVNTVSDQSGGGPSGVRARGDPGLTRPSTSTNGARQPIQNGGPNGGTSDVTEYTRAHRNGVSVHIHLVVSCALADQRRPSPIRVQYPPPGSRFEHRVVKPSIIVPGLEEQ